MACRQRTLITGLNVQRVQIPALPSTGASQYNQVHQGLIDETRRFCRVTTEEVGKGDGVVETDTSDTSDASAVVDTSDTSDTADTSDTLTSGEGGIQDNWR